MCSIDDDCSASISEMLSLTTALTTAATRPPLARHMSLLGGEWAGWCCAASAATGELHPVPEKYCSDAMIEWGQVPMGFEECTTEAGSERRTVRFLPEDGCSVEDLPAEVSRATLPRPVPSTEGTVVALDVMVEDGGSGPSTMWRCETIFEGHGGVLPRQRKTALESMAQRTRVSILFDATTGSLAAREPIRIWQERCWSQETNQLAVREGGGRSGVDAAWLSTAIGMGNFGDAKPLERAALERDDDGTLRVALAGGVSLACRPGALDVALANIDGKSIGMLRREFVEGAVTVR